MKIKIKTTLLSITSIAILIGIVGYSFYHINNKENIKSEIENSQSAKDLQLSILSGMVYRHLIAYSLVCKEAGVELNKYPDYFSQKYKTAIQKINYQWEQKGTSLQGKLIYFDKKIYPTISQDVKKELIDLERLTAKYVLAHQQGVSVDKIKWTDKLEQKLNLKDACILLDEEASFFLDQSAFDNEFSDRLTELD